MWAPIETYGLIGDTRTVALVGRDGAIDWMCVPRFDGGACFAALLGERRHGHWTIAPMPEATRAIRRRYRPDSLVLETETDTVGGTVRITDFMPPCGLLPGRGHEAPAVVRLLEGVAGEVAVKMQLVVRFDYGAVVPWACRLDGRLHLVGGPDALVLDTPAPIHGAQLTTVANLTVRAGDRIPFVLAWHRSHEPAPPRLDVDDALARTEAWWRAWAARCTYSGPWREAVVRSLITLKALTYGPTGAIVAAATTSLPERVGGVRNWDYRFSWLRDATFTLYALMASGYRDEARAWRDWLRRAVAGDPRQLQIMYGIAGERRLPELSLPLPGYAGSRPVRIGNAAVDQLQLDVHGEVLDALYHARRAGMPVDRSSWQLQQAMLEVLATTWCEPDEGLWEVRGPRQHFTHSKVMAWVAFDRAVRSAETQGLPGPVERWRRIRAEIHADVCAHGFDPRRNTFTQAYGSPALDAALLLLPQVGFLPADDPRVAGTVAAIERTLVRDGFARRYATEQTDDGLPVGEGTFLLCSFWLADAYVLLGRHDEARALFERLLAVRNDVGLLAEQYDPVGRRLLGNFPQAFSHVGLVNTALNLSPHQPTPARERPDG